MELRFVGGVFGGNIKPTPFLCLILKMLQIQPEKDIVVEFIKNGVTLHSVVYLTGETILVSTYTFEGVTHSDILKLKVTE